MTAEKTFFLEATWEENRLNVCFYEHSTTLRIKLSVTIKHDKISELSSAIIALIHRSYFQSAGSSQIQEDLKRECICLFNDLLPEKVRTRIKNISGGNIVLLIDEPLVFVPWELLNDGDDYLCLRFSIGRIVRTTRQLRDTARRILAMPPKMLVLADPCGDLIGAQNEARVIRNELDQNGQVIVSTKTADISLEYVRKHISDYDLLHYAGHADHGISHDSVGLRLADGCFSVNDIIDLGGTAPLPALIFCNACQSAHDAASDMNRGVFGIANAFLTSGVRHFIGCLWKVSDKESVTAAQLFYRAVFSGKKVGEALRLTRLELIEQYGRSNLVWAAYIVYGDPSVVFGGGPADKPKLDKDTGAMKTRIGKILVGLFLLGGLSLAFYANMRPPVPPALVINDFLDLTTQKKDSVMTFEVVNELKKISIAPLLDPVQTSGGNVFRVKRRRTVFCEFERNDDMLRVTLKVIDPGTDRIISVKNLTVRNSQENSKEIAENILELVKTGLSRAEQIEVTRKPGENPEVHRLLVRSWDLYKKGRLLEALRLCERIRIIEPESRDLYKRLGNIYDRLGHRDKALSAYQRYAELCYKSNDLRGLSNANINMGWIYQTFGDEKLAFKKYNSALQIAQLGKYSYETAKAYSVLGGWHARQKNFIMARELLHKSIQINEQNLPDENHKYYLAANYNELGLAAETEQKYAESLKYLNLSLALFKEIGAEKVVAEVTERIERVFDKQMLLGLADE